MYFVFAAQQLFQPVANASPGGQVFDLPPAYLAAVAAANANPQSFPQQPQIPLPTLAQQHAFLAMQDIASAANAASVVNAAAASLSPATSATVAGSQQQQSNPQRTHQKRRFSSPNAENQFGTPATFDGQVALPVNGPWAQIYFYFFSSPIFAARTINRTINLCIH